MFSLSSARKPLPCRQCSTQDPPRPLQLYQANVLSLIVCQYLLSTITILYRLYIPSTIAVSLIRSIHPVAITEHMVSGTYSTPTELVLPVLTDYFNSFQTSLNSVCLQVELFPGLVLRPCCQAAQRMGFSHSESQCQLDALVARCDVFQWETHHGSQPPVQEREWMDLKDDFSTRFHSMRSSQLVTPFLSSTLRIYQELGER